MPGNVYQVRDVGIYHGLPVYDSSIRGLSAIVTGANGISGHHMVRVLAQSPWRWSKIYCLSRRPPALLGGLPSNAKHIPLDFLQDPITIGNALRERGVRADHVFFFSYIQVEPNASGELWSNAEEMCKANGKLLSNFLQALPIAGIKPRRIMLQTGAKNYGIHLGPTSVPQEETDPRVTLEPNFYYEQEDILWKYCREHHAEWSICMPSYILGAVPDAAMNLCFPLAIYASISKVLGEKLVFPGSLESWESPQSQSSAMLNAYMEEWTALSPKAGNRKFNAFDDSAFTWGKFWPKLAAAYGLEYTRPDLGLECQERKQRHQIPPRGFGPHPSHQHRFTMVQWAQRTEVKEAWKRLAMDHNLMDKELRDVERIFSFLDGALSWSQSIYFSTNQARALGWHGHVDSSESIFAVLKDFEYMEMIPPLKTSY